MRAAERRERILELLHNAEAPISGSALAQMMGVSRQIIVQDITLLRTGLGIDILSTYQGYVIPRQQVVCSRVYKVRHSTDRTEEELWNLRRLEHRRWNAYMRSEGYTYAPVRNDLAKVHHCLVPFDDLPLKEQVKDDD